MEFCDLNKKDLEHALRGASVKLTAYSEFWLHIPASFEKS